MVDHFVHVANIERKHREGKLFIQTCELLAMNQTGAGLLRHNFT